jgi:hypothetical protein
MMTAAATGWGMGVGTVDTSSSPLQGGVQAHQQSDSPPSPATMARKNRDNSVRLKLFGPGNFGNAGTGSMTTRKSQNSKLLELPAEILGGVAQSLVDSQQAADRYQGLRKLGALSTKLHVVAKEISNLDIDAEMAGTRKKIKNMLASFTTAVEDPIELEKSLVSLIAQDKSVEPPVLWRRSHVDLIANALWASSHLQNVKLAVRDPVRFKDSPDAMARQAIDAVVAIKSTNPDLRTISLDLRKSSMSDADTAYAVAQLRRLSGTPDEKVKLTLNLSLNKIGDEGIRVLFAALPDLGVEEINVSGNDFGELGQAIIEDARSAYASVKIINAPVTRADIHAASAMD